MLRAPRAVLALRPVLGARGRATPLLRLQASSPASTLLKTGTLINFSVPLPSPTGVERAEFHLPANTPLQVLFDSIKHESPSVSTVTIRVRGGDPIQASQTLGELFSSGANKLLVQIDDKQHTIVTSTPGLEKLDSGILNLAAVSYQAKLLTLREAIHDVQAPTITLNAFYELGEEQGLTSLELESARKDLHRTGVILHFENEPSISDTVYLKPEEIFASIYAKFGLNSPLEGLLERKVSTLRNSITETEEKLKPYIALQHTLSQQAARTVSVYMWGLTLASASGFGLYWYLVYEYLSWDIMEPVTFFTGLALTALGYSWWIWSNRDDSHSSIYEHWLENEKNKRLARGNLDQGAMKALLEHQARLQQELESVTQRQFAIRILGQLTQDQTQTSS